MSARRLPAAVVALGLAVALAPASASAATVRSTADGLPLLSAAAATKLLDQRRGELCGVRRSKARTPTPKVALADARRIVRRGKGAAAERRFLRSAQARTADRALAAAGAATLAGRPAAALAALLRAHRLRPRDQRPLVGAATVLTQLGRPAAALALLDAAARLPAPKRGPLGQPPRALRQNARGHALLGLGRWKEAEQALRPAVAAAPLLREARANLAHAELCRRGSAAAARTAVAATRRAGAPAQTTSTPPEDGPVVVQAATPLWLDVAPGVLPTLPSWSVPRDESESRGMLEGLRERERAQFGAFSQVVTAMQAAAAAAAPARARLSAAGGGYLRALDVAFARPQLQPGLRDVYARTTAADGAWRRLQSRDLGPAGSACGHFGEWRAAYLAHEDAARAWMREQYRYQSGIAANVADPALHASYMARARMSLATVMNLVRQSARSLAEYGSSCAERTAAVGVEEQGQLEQPDSLACPPALKGLSFRVKVQVVQIALSCESASIELDSGTWIGAFVNVGHNVRKGETTVFVGPRAKTTVPGPLGTGASVKDGLYVTVGNDGTIRDVGARVSVAASATSGQASTAYTIDSMDFSLVGVSPLGAILGD